jgi:hypothetical protein
VIDGIQQVCRQLPTDAPAQQVTCPCGTTTGATYIAWEVVPEGAVGVARPELLLPEPVSCAVPEPKLIVGAQESRSQDLKLGVEVQGATQDGGA